MQKWFRPRRLILVWILILIVIVIGFHTLPSRNGANPVPQTWGVTFTASHAQYLGLDWKKTYREMLDDLKVRWIRLGVPWDAIEPAAGELNLVDIRWQLDEARKRGARVLLVVGRKIPRWPECHIPDWVKSLPEPEQEVQTLTMLRKVVESFKDYPAIWAWQVENEPLFPFGDCPSPNSSLYRQEVALVRSLDTRPIVGTDSGELSSWWTMSSIVDILGVSIYRSVYHPIIGYTHYPFSPAMYARKAWLVRGRVGRVISSEVQMEPWSIGGFIDQPVGDQTAVFTPEDFKKNLAFIRKTGFDTFYFWGVEWWAWMKEKNNDARYWDLARTIFNPS